jgi:hypothetical protein
MKKILLFASIIFLALFSNKIKAQTIDSLVISSVIECPGDEGTIDVFISNANNNNYSIVLLRFE